MKDEYDFSKMTKRDQPLRVDVQLSPGDVKEDLKGKLKFFSIKSVQESRSGYVVVKSFFVVKNDCFCFFKKSLQANEDERVVTYLKEKLYPGLEIKELTIYLPPNFIETLG